MATTKTSPPSLLWAAVDGTRIDLPDPTKTTPTVEDVIEIIHGADVGVTCEYESTGALPNLTLVGTTPEANAALNRLSHAVHTSLRNVRVVVYTRRDQTMECPDCGSNVRREAFLDHRGSLMCQAMQERASLRQQGYRRVGRAWRALEKAGIDLHWIPHGGNEGIDDKGEITNGGIDYVRVAPRWAVLVSEVTVVEHDLRVVVLEHCNEHDAARRAIEAALRLAPGNTRRRRGKSVNTKDKKRMTEIFEGVLRTVGP